MDEIIAAFEAEHPDITIEKNTIGGGPYNESLNLALQGGSGPDVFVIPTVSGSVDTGFREYLDLGYLYNLSQFEDVDDFMASFPNPEIDFVEGNNLINGELYTAPFNGPQRPWLQLYVNTNLYEQAGLVDENGEPQLPTTWGEFMENSRVIAENTDAYGTGFSMQQPWAAGWWYRVCNYSAVPFDGSVGAFDFRTGEYTYASNDCYKTVLNDLVTMVDEDLIYPDTLSLSIDDEGARAAFAEDRFAHLVGGEWVIGGWAETHPDFEGYTATHLPFPQAEPQGYFESLIGGQWFAINPETDVAEAAWEFFKFLHSPEAGDIWAQGGNGLVLNTPQPYEQYAENDAFAYIFNSTDMVRTFPNPAVRTPALARVQATLVGPSPDDLLVGILSGQISDVDAALGDLNQRKTQALELGVSDAQAAGADVSLEDYLFPDWNPAEDYLTEPAGADATTN